jgi:hypothetical protein
MKALMREMKALMMEEANTSETVNFYQTTRRNNPEDSNFHKDVSLFRLVQVLQWKIY